MYNIHFIVYRNLFIENFGIQLKQLDFVKISLFVVVLNYLVSLKVV